jgi:hypothetical protein
MKSRHKLQLAWAIREHRTWEIYDGQTMAYELFPPNLHNYAAEYFTCNIHVYLTKWFSTRNPLRVCEATVWNATLFYKRYKNSLWCVATTLSSFSDKFCYLLCTCSCLFPKLLLSQFCHISLRLLQAFLCHGNLWKDTASSLWRFHESHSNTLQSSGLLWRSDQIDAETSTWQHTTLTRDKLPCPWRDSNSYSQQASGRRPTPYTARPLKSAFVTQTYMNPLNAELNPICQLLALIGAHHILHVSRIRVNFSYVIFVFLCHVVNGNLLMVMYNFVILVKFRMNC